MAQQIKEELAFGISLQNKGWSQSGQQPEAGRLAGSLEQEGCLKDGPRQCSSRSSRHNFPKGNTRPPTQHGKASGDESREPAREPLPRQMQSLSPPIPDGAGLLLFGKNLSPPERLDEAQSCPCFVPRAEMSPRAGSCPLPAPALLLPLLQVGRSPGLAHPRASLLHGPCLPSSNSQGLRWRGHSEHPKLLLGATSNNKLFSYIHIQDNVCG